MNDTTLWISHSAINAFDNCPKSYYYKYQYKNPKTGNRIQIVNPYFSLGLAVHQTLEELSDFSIEKRKEISLKDRYEEVWEDFSGKQGGFISEKQEKEFKDRGEKMIEKVIQTDFFEKPSVQIEEDVPSIDLIPEKNIKLVGSLDWIQRLSDDNLHIVDFKTGKNKEKNGSLQLPIYNILANKKLNDKVEKFSYWYLESDGQPTPKKLDSIEDSLNIIRKKALEIYQYVQDDNYSCHYNGNCFACSDFKKIFAGEAEYLGTDSTTGKDLFFVLNEEDIIKKLLDSEVLDDKETKVFQFRMDGQDLNSIQKELQISKERINKISSSIKEKMVKALTTKEVKILINKRLNSS